MGSGPVRDDREREGRGVMAEATAHNEVPADHDPECEHSAIRARACKKDEDHNAAGHVPYRSWCRACVAGRGRSDAHLTSRSFVSATTTTGIDYGYLEDKVTLGEQEAGPSPILVDHTGVAAVLPCKGTAHPWCVQALERAIVATGDAKSILRSDNESAILDLKRHAAAEYRVRNGMTVIIDDTTEYELQDNGLAEMAVREVKGVACSVRVALSELYKKDISSKHPVLPWLVSNAAGQITRGQTGADGLTPHQRLKGRAFRKLLPVSAESVLHFTIGMRASYLAERWSDGLFLGVVERSSEFCVGTVLDVVRARSLRRRPLEKRANVELLDKLVVVPWQPVHGDSDSSAVPTVISAEPIAEGDDLPDRADVTVGAARTFLRKNIELRRHGNTGGCPGCDAARLNTTATQHTAACRARVGDRPCSVG